MFQAVNHDLIRGVLHLPASSSGDGFVLTHGAGSNCDAPLLVALATVFESTGVTVLRCDLPFRQRRPHGPPPRGSADDDQEGLRGAVKFMHTQGPRRIYLGGHSYGGRQASMLAASQPGIVDGLLLLSYPLHPPKRPTELRTAHFPTLRTSTLFVHGSSDGFGTLDEIAQAAKLIPARTEIVEIGGTGHKLLTNRNAVELPCMIVQAFRKFYGM